MAVKAQAQQTLIDLTDGYSVMLTSEAYNFPGTTNAAKAGSCTTQIIAMRGKDQVAASVDVTKLTKPTGISVTKNSDATSPTLTITASTALTSAGEISIPVSITGTDIVINKKFSFSIAFTGATGGKGDKGDTGNGIASTLTEYQSGTSGTTVPTGTWVTTVPTVADGHYLWTRVTTTFTDSTTNISYSVAKQGQTGGTGKGVKSTATTYQVGTSGTTAPTGTWNSSPVATTSAGQYLWTRTVTTYTDNTTSTAYSVAAHGAKGQKGDTGDNGEDALILVITSSNGLIFKNTDIATVLTAHVYKGGLELTGSTSPKLSEVGTIKWYKDAGSTAVATGQTLSISAGDVDNKADYIAKLEG